MAGIVKTVIRIGVIGGLATGAAVLIAGPDRVAAVANQTKSKIVDVIDANIDDPIAMRSQLRSLEAQYPERIAEVRSHLAELKTQRDEIVRERQIADRVVSLARVDFNEIQSLIAMAEEAKADGSFVRVSFDNRTYNLDNAYRRAADISDTIDLYQARMHDYENDLANLDADAEQLENLLAKLEREHDEFQTQLAHLERQIDAVARKERMVDVMAERQKKLDELSKYRVASLDQFKSRLAERTAELDAKLASLSRSEGRADYEDQARVELSREASAKARYERSLKSVETARPRPTVEIGPDDLEQTDDEADKVASSNR